MSIRWTERGRAALLALGLAAWASAAAAETTACLPITSVPVIITQQGVYCFTGDVETAITAGGAITIATNNVTIDLNGHKLGGLAAGAGTTAAGIIANERQNITVKNGIVRGFLVGISLRGAGSSQGHVVEDVRLDQNRWRGVEVEGRGSIVRRNQVVATGGSSLAANASGTGIHATGTGHRILDNDVITVTTQDTIISRGIRFDAGTDNFAEQNRITQVGCAIEYSATASGKYRANLSSSTLVPFAGGTDAGDNN
jgi:hypothetical protein